MTVSIDPPETADPIDVEYLRWDAVDSPVMIRMHLDAVDGIARDVVEGFRALPGRGLEVGGLLLGRVQPGERPIVWVERYQRIECEHREGPRFVLDDTDLAGFEQVAMSIAAAGELNVIGLYRSHTRPGFELEEPDLRLFDRYFNDPTDLILLVKPENVIDIWARFYTRGDSGEPQGSGETFQFRGRVVGSLSGDLGNDDAPVAPPMEEEITEAPRERMEQAPAGPPAPEPEAQPEPEAVHREPRRLVPDFGPLDTPRRPMPESLRAAPLHFTEDPDGSHEPGFLRKWWPAFGAVALVAGALWLLFPQSSRRDAAPAPGATEATASVRPLGLYVDPTGATWRVSWNAGATALAGARQVALFVRDGEDQTRIDLSPADIQSATYQYPPKDRDVTFRLEVTDKAGRLSAESFRVVSAPPKAASASGAKSPAAAPAEPPAPSGRGSIAPRAIRKVPPVVPSSIRPRIRGTIPIDVRVRVDTRGKVMSATPVTKLHSGLESYLGVRAVAAARQWRFEPARENGRAVQGTETLHFVFQP